MQHGAWNSLQVLGPDRNWCFLWFLAGTYTCPEKELERMSQHIFWSSTWRFGFASTSFHPQTFLVCFALSRKPCQKPTSHTVSVANMYVNSGPSSIAVSICGTRMEMKYRALATLRTQLWYPSMTLWVVMLDWEWVTMAQWHNVH